MKDIAIYGAGGFGRETACLLRMINEKQPTWNLIGFFDDGKEKGSRNEYGEILGGMAEVNAWSTPLAMVIAIGSPKIVSILVRKINSMFIEFPNIIAPNVGYADNSNFSIGKGNIIGGGSWFSCNVTIGNFNVFNGSVVIGHDVVIGNYNSIMPNARISGEVNLGDRNYLGISSIILQKVKVPDGVILGAGSVLIRKPKAESTYIGNPATIIKF